MKKRADVYFAGAAYGPRDAAVHKKVMAALRAMTQAELVALVNECAPPESKPRRRRKR